MKAHQLYQQAIKQVVGTWLGEATGQVHHTSSERRSMLHQAEILGLPSQYVDPIQQLDPTKPNFGGFLYMMDYDALP